MTGLSVLLVLGLVALIGLSLRTGFDWDATVVQLDHDDGTRSEGPGTTREMHSLLVGDGVIHFDVSRLNEQGLQGPPDGLRALSYEFCIPAVEAHVREVETIDPTIVIQRDSPGRVGCGEAEYLAMGHTHQGGFRDVLNRLSRLSYITRIEESFFE